jgi:hypothetical protein
VSVLTAVCLLLLASCGRDTTAPAAPETAVSAAAGISASATDNRPSLVLATSPGGAAAGLAFTTQPVVELRNNGGNLVMATNKTVTVSLDGSNVALRGTKTVALVKGVAKFTNLSIPAAGTYVLLFTGDSFAPAHATIIVAPSTVPLTVAVIGNGTVTSSPAGISCTANCSNGFSANEVVTLTAQSTDPAWHFAGWSGDACTVTGPGTCQITMDAAKSVTATFSPVNSGPPVLTMTITGAGSITSDQVDANDNPIVLCTAAQGLCTSTETLNTTVTLIATPAGGATFVGWGGACADAGTSISCDVLMDQARSVTAEFAGPQQLARNNTPNLTSFMVRPRAAQVAGTQ